MVARNNRGVKVGEGGLVGGWICDLICEQVRHGREESGLEGMLLGADARGSSDHWEGRVGVPEGSEEELGAEEGQVVVDGEVLGL